MANDADINLTAPSLSGAGITGTNASGDITLLAPVPSGFNDNNVAAASITLPRLVMDDDGGGMLVNDDTFSDGEILLWDGDFGANLIVEGVLQSSGMYAGGEMFLPELVVEGSLEPPLAMPIRWQVDASGYAGTIAAGQVSLRSVGLDGGIDDPKLLPELTLDATGQASSLITGAVVMPLLDAAGSLAPPLSLPEFDLAGRLLGGVLANGDITLPSMTVAAMVGTYADIELPQPQVTATAHTGVVASGAVALRRWQVAASHRQDTDGHGLVSFGLVAVDGTGSTGTRIDGTVTISRLQLAALATAGTTSTATLTLPLLAVNGRSRADGIGNAQIELPALLVAGTGHGPPVQTHVTLALNTQVAAVSTYDAFGANSFARFAGVTLAATDDGIVALAGDTDLGELIDAEVVSGVSDYGSDNFKRIIAGYVGYRSTGDMELTLIAENHGEYSYRLEPRLDDNGLHATRVKFGRGADSRYWQWKLANSRGADFAFDALGLDFETLSKKVR